MIYKLIYNNIQIGFCYSYIVNANYYEFHMISPETGKPDILETVYRIKKEHVKGIHTNDITQTIKILMHVTIEITRKG